MDKRVLTKQFHGKVKEAVHRYLYTSFERGSINLLSGPAVKEHLDLVKEFVYREGAYVHIYEYFKSRYIELEETLDILRDKYPRNKVYNRVSIRFGDISNASCKRNEDLDFCESFNTVKSVITKRWYKHLAYVPDRKNGIKVFSFTASGRVKGGQFNQIVSWIQNNINKFIFIDDKQRTPLIKVGTNRYAFIHAVVNMHHTLDINIHRAFLIHYKEGDSTMYSFLIAYNHNN